jgi:glycosyltransferase involved in cell wall biosynthesis
MISIITPTYNREVLLQRTVASILAQTYTDWELIIVDDGSTDNTEQVVQQYLSDSRIKYVKKQNTGQAHSLNVGVTHAKREFITFLDSDDEAYPEWLKTNVQNIKQDTGIVCSGSVKKFQDGSTIEDKPIPYIMYDQKIRVKFTCGSLFIRRACFNAIGGYDIELKSNIQTDLGYRLIAYIRSINMKVVTLDCILVQINIHDGPRIRTSWEKVRAGGIQFFNKHGDYFRKYDHVGLSYICGSIAFSNYKLKKRGEAISYLMKAIKYNPSRLANYLKLVKYAIR